MIARQMSVGLIIVIVKSYETRLMFYFSDRSVATMLYLLCKHALIAERFVEIDAATFST